MRNPRERIDRPAAAQPSRPATATTSPGSAPERRTGVGPEHLPDRGHRDHDAVAAHEVAAHDRRSLGLGLRAHARVEVRDPLHRQVRGQPQRDDQASSCARPSPRRRSGSAPRPWPRRRAPVDQSRRKCRPSTSMSVETTTRPPLTPTTAASSPMPTWTPVALCPSRAASIRAIRPNSPTSLISSPPPLIGSTLATAATASCAHASLNPAPPGTRVAPTEGQHRGARLHPDPDRGGQGPVGGR